MNSNIKRRMTMMVMMFLSLAMVTVGCAKGADNDNASPKQSQLTATNSSDQPTDKLQGSIEVSNAYTEGTAGYNFTKKVADSLTQENPGTKIDFVFANGKTRPDLNQRWRTGNPPDADYAVFNALLPKTHEFVNEKKLLDLTPAMNEKLAGTDTKWQDTFLPLVQPLMTLNDHIYAVPTEVTVFVLFHNKEIFDDLKLSPPKTWDELLAVSKTLKNNKIDPIAVTGQENSYMGMWSDYLFLREAGYDETVKAIRGGGFKDNPAFLSAAQKVQDLRDNDYFLKGFSGVDFTGAQMNFFQGKAGMILMGSWLVAEMKDSIPSDFQVGVVPFPSISGGKGNPNDLFGTANMLSVASASKNQPLTIEFLKRFTDKSVQKQRSQELELISPIKDVPVSDKMIGLKDVMENGSLGMRYFGLENDADLFNAYYNETSKFFLGEYNAEQYIDGLDVMTKKFAK